MEERCGGAVEKLQKTHLAASIQSIIARRTRMKMRLENRALLTDRQMKITVRKPTFVVSAAKRRVTLSMSAWEIPISGHSRMLSKKKRGLLSRSRLENFSLTHWAWQVDCSKGWLEGRRVSMNWTHFLKVLWGLMTIVTNISMSMYLIHMRYLKRLERIQILMKTMMVMMERVEGRVIGIKIIHSSLNKTLTWLLTKSVISSSILTTV